MKQIVQCPDWCFLISESMHSVHALQIESLMPSGNVKGRGNKLREILAGTCTAILITGTRDFITKMPGCLFSVDQMRMLYLKAPHPLSPRDSPPLMTGISHLSTGSTSSFNWTVHDIIGDTCTITNSCAGHFGTYSTWYHDIIWYTITYLFTRTLWSYWISWLWYSMIKNERQSLYFINNRKYMSGNAAHESLG